MNSLWDNAVTARTLSTYGQALEAIKFSNISVDEQSAIEYGSTTRVSADVVCLYFALCYKHLRLQYNTIKLYLCGIYFAYLPTGVQCPLIEHNNSRRMDYYVIECVKCIQGQLSDQDYNREILQTG